MDTVGLALIFIMGLRHGLDPDHIAVIDGMSMQLHARKSKYAPWIGCLFALGHGIAITVVAGLVSLGVNSFHFSGRSMAWMEWIPVVLLLWVGSANMYSLLGGQHYHPAGWRTHLLPRKLRSSSRPVTVLLIGILFAMVLDTASQAVAWGYAACEKGGPAMALLLGAVFTLGMMITDTIDGLLLHQIIRKAAVHKNVWRYRRTLGWLIVLASFAIAGDKITTWFNPETTLSE